MSVTFWEDGNAHYDADNNQITLPDPDWTAKVSGPGYAWQFYWSTVVHEVAHYFIFKWFGGINHRETFYSVLIALHFEWDLPEWSYSQSERDYHGLGYFHGKGYVANFVMDRVRRLGIGVANDCDYRRLYENRYCRGRWKSGQPCKVHASEREQSSLSVQHRSGA